MDRKELQITADLAYLELQEEEAVRLETEVTQMLEYFTKMSEVDVDSLQPTTHALLTQNRVRNDNSNTFNNPESLVNNAPEAEDNFIIIPNVL